MQPTLTLRNSEPEIRARQPDRRKNLRTSERAHEVLERLSEQYYRRLEKSSTMPAPEEIEAMHDAEAGSA